MKILRRTYRLPENLVEEIEVRAFRTKKHTSEALVEILEEYSKTHPIPPDPYEKTNS